MGEHYSSKNNLKIKEMIKRNAVAKFSLFLHSTSLYSVLLLLEMYILYKFFKSDAGLNKFVQSFVETNLDVLLVRNSLSYMGFINLRQMPQIQSLTKICPLLKFSVQLQQWPTST